MTVPRRALVAALLATLCGMAVPVAAGSPPPAGVVVRDAWARATPPGSPVAAVYLTIEGGAGADRLLGASTAAAGMTQVHAVTQSDGMARMRETDGVEIPAGGRVSLAPGGLHLMLMDLARPLVAGTSFEVTLEFAHAGRRVVRVEVIAPDRPAPAGP